MAETALSEVADITEASESTDDVTNSEEENKTSEENNSESDDKSKDKEEDKSKDKDKSDDKVTEYEDFSLPEGVSIDEGTLTTFTEFAKRKELTQEEAQELVDMQTKIGQENVKANDDRWADIRAGWIDESKADKEIGGVDFEIKLGVAGRAINKYGTKALVELLNLHGIGDHPEFIRYSYRIGKTLKEDTSLRGKGSEDKRDASDKLYPNQNKE